MKKVLLVRPDSKMVRKIWHPINCRPPYTLKYIQALLKKEARFVVNFIDAYAAPLSFNKLVDITLALMPDILVIYSSPFDIEYTMQYINEIKRKISKAIIILLGPGPSSLIDLYHCNGDIDFVLPCESEIETYSILKKISYGETILGLRKYYNGLDKDNLFLVRDLDSLPFIEFTKEEIRKYAMIYPLRINRPLRWGHVLSSRGCPYSCIFCSPLMRDSYGKELRLRSAKNVIDEIKYQLSWGANIISFDDDNFTISKDHVSSICYEILKRRMRFSWIVHARVDELDSSLLKLMKEAGCVLLRFGIESGSERIIKILDKTKDSHLWFKKCREAVKEAKALGISVACLFMVGNPTETKGDLKESIKFAKTLHPDIIQVAYFVPFPGSRAYELYIDKVKGIPVSDMHHYMIPLVNLGSMNCKDLRVAQSEFYANFIMNYFFMLKHIFKYFIFYIANPYIFFRLLPSVKKIINNRASFLRVTKRNF